MSAICELLEEAFVSALAISVIRSALSEICQSLYKLFNLSWKECPPLNVQLANI